MPVALQPSLAGGELSPALHGRVDLARYQISVETCRNWIVNPYGGVMNRPGFEFCAEALGASRLIAFQFSSSQNYIIELGPNQMRFLVNGALVASGGVPVVVSTPWPASAVFGLKFVQSADVMTFVHPDYPPYELKRLSHTSWTLTPRSFVEGPFEDLNTDTEKYVRASNTDGLGITLTAPVAVFAAQHVGRLFKLEQHTASHAWEPGKRVTKGDIRRANGRYYKALSDGTTGQNIPLGTIQWNDGGVTWEYLNDGYGICRITSVAGDGKSAVADVLVTLPAEAAMRSGEGYGSPITINTIAEASPDPMMWFSTTAGHGLIPGASGVVEVLDSGGDKHAYSCLVVDANKVYIGFPYSSYVASGLSFVSYTAPAFMASAGASTNSYRYPSYKWAFGAFGDASIGGPGYPSAVTYYQGRLCFAGTYGQPDTVWMSESSNWTNWNVVTPVLDSSPIVFTLGSTQLNGIRSMLQLSELLLMTSGAVWSVGSGDVLTPSTLSTRLQSYTGAASSPEPLGIEGSALFVTDKGKSIKETSFRFEQNGFVGQDLTLFARHLFESKTVVDWAYRAAPFPCVWAVRNDGVLLGCSYVKDQEVAAWHQHTTEGGLFESVSCIGESGEDFLYAVVKRGTKRYIERMASRQVEALEDGFFVDCGSTYSGAAATTISGLSHMNGKQVVALADGGVVKNLKVVGGAVTLPYAASKVHIGIPITCDLKTLSIAPPQQGSLRTRTQTVPKVNLMVQDSRSFWVGRNEAGLWQAKIRPVPEVDPVPELVTGVVEVQIGTTWEKDSSFLVRHQDPTPVTILALAPEVEIGG